MLIWAFRMIENLQKLPKVKLPDHSFSFRDNIPFESISRDQTLHGSIFCDKKILLIKKHYFTNANVPSSSFTHYLSFVCWQLLQKQICAEGLTIHKPFYHFVNISTITDWSIFKKASFSIYTHMKDLHYNNSGESIHWFYKKTKKNAQFSLKF